MPDAQSQQEVVAVIVSYRSAELAARAVSSLLDERRSTGVPEHIVLVDNDSGDYPDLVAAARADNWGDVVELVRSPNNGGFGAGNNLGVSVARAAGAARYYLFLNPDTVCLGRAVCELKLFLDAHPEAGIVGSGFENGDGSLWPIAFRFPGLLSEIEEGVNFGPVSHVLHRWKVAKSMSQDRVSRVDWVSGACMLIRADLFHRLGGFDERFFLYFEETDLCRRALQLGWSTWYQPQARVVHISGQSTKVTGQQAQRRRLPAYWFDSRSRYFKLGYGPLYALLIDVVSVAATLFGKTLSTVRGRAGGRLPFFALDVILHGALSGKFFVEPPVLGPREVSDVKTDALTSG